MRHLFLITIIFFLQLKHKIAIYEDNREKYFLKLFQWKLFVLTSIKEEQLICHLENYQKDYDNNFANMQFQLLTVLFISYIALINSNYSNWMTTYANFFLYNHRFTARARNKNWC